MTSISAATQDAPTSANAKVSPLNTEFDKTVELALKNAHVAGLSIAVIDGNETFSKGYGVATFPDTKVTPLTLFYGASTSKSFTAAAASLLIDDTVNSSEPLTWQTTLSSMMREDFVMADEWTSNHVTLEDALSHRTGLGRHDFSYGGSNQTIRDTVRSIRNLPLTYEIRTKWQYNNLMYAAVAHAIELHTKSWLGDFLAQRIWKPLKMFNTFFSLKDAQAASAARNLSLATGYTWINKTQEFHKLPAFDDHAVIGAHGVISNVVEYTKWLRCHIDESSPLSSIGHEELHYPRATFNAPPLPEPLNYALGWMRVNYRGEPVYFHQGAMSGFAAIMAYLPRRKWGIAMMSNTGGTRVDTVLRSLSYVLVDDLLQTPAEERSDFYAITEQIASVSTELMKNPKEAAYPDAPRDEKAISLSLPLKAYAGQYTHLAYQNLNVILIATPPYLSVDPAQPAQILQVALKGTFPRVLDFQHVSGEFFVVYDANAYTYEVDQGGSDPDLHQLSKAEFRISESGTVKEMGILLEPDMGEEKIWFQRV